jgi:hypothetical protein
MKNLLTILFSFSTIFIFGQNTNTMSMMIDGKEFTTQPRQIKIGNYAYFTGNLVSPDKMLRIYLADFTGKAVSQSGKYLVLQSREADTDENIKKAAQTQNWKGIATVRYVEETKSPRMQFHVGDSQNNQEYLDVVVKDGIIEMTFSTLTLQGTHWKEKATASVFGGLSRITDKLTDKAVTSASGFDSDMDPEGRGYKKQKETDKVILTNGKMKFKL